MQRVEANRDHPGVALFDTALWVFTALVAVIALILAIDWVVRVDTFPVRAVRFEGPFRHVTQAELETAVLDSVRVSFLRVDLDAIKVKVEQLPWVQSASVRRAWPRDVSVQYTEQQLLARWNADAWVNQAMQAVRVPFADAARETPRDVPQLEGPEGTAWQVFERHQVLNTLLAPAGLKLARLSLTPRRTWRLELSNGLVLVLDREDVEHKVERFARAWPALQREGRAIRQIDLRYTNGFAVEWASRTGRGAASEQFREAG